MQLITFPKRYLASTSIHRNWRYLQMSFKKRLNSNKKTIWISWLKIVFACLSWKVYNEIIILSTNKTQIMLFTVNSEKHNLCFICTQNNNFNMDFSRLDTFLDIQLKIFLVSVNGFLCKIAFWKRYELHFIRFKFHHKIFWTSLSNLALKLKFAENQKRKNGFFWIILKFQVICWDIYYFSERLWCQLSKILHSFKKFWIWKKKLVEGRCVREVPREFDPCCFLVPSILVK